MKQKILKILFILTLIMTLVMADFILVGREIAIAMYDELEAQSESTNVKNVDFDAYFLNNNEKVHFKENNLDSEETLILNINVKEKGLLNNAKIKINEANFTILKDKVKNNYIKNINLETNEIELNQIIYQNNVTIEIPIAFKKQENFEEDYFEKENTISITGTYTDTKDVEVAGEIKTRMAWKQPTDVNLSQTIEKYIDLKEKGILLQQHIITEVQNNKLPRENENLEVKVPILDENAPKSLVVLLNGNKLSDENITYNQESKTLEIRNKSNGVWGKAKNEYKVIYIYNSEKEFTNQITTINTKMATKLYTQDNIEKQDEQTINTNQIGSVASISKTVTPSLYKGYLYAAVPNETTFDEYNCVEISEVSSVFNIEINKEHEYFMDESENKISVNQAILYKSSSINKNEFIKLFGENGEIAIKDANNNVITIINKDTDADENGNIVISYSGEMTDIKMITSQPIQEGTLLIRNTRAIKGNTGYDKNQLKSFKKLVTSAKVTTNLSEETAEAQTILEDTITEANISLNTNNLSTLQENKNVQISIDLKTDTNKYDLYKNPTIQIKLPDDVENIKLNSEIQKLYGDEFTMSTAAYNESTRTILLKFEGEQTAFGNSANKGMHVVIDANITLNKLASTKQENIIMTYTNENGNEAQYQKTIGVNIKSKDGVLTYANVNDYNAEEESTETFVQDVANGKLDAGQSARVATANMAIVNNYDTQISDVVIIGEIPGKKEKQINDKTVSSTFVTSLAEAVTTNNDGAKIYYSEDENATENSDTWSETIENLEAIRAYKIVFNDNKIDAFGMTSFGYKFMIPENLGKNQSTYVNYDLIYSYSGQRVTMHSTTVLATEMANEPNENANNNEMGMLSSENETIKDLDGQTVEIADGITAKVVATTADKELKNGDEIYEGQTVKYSITVKNNSGVDVNNLQMIAKQTNAVFYGEVKREAIGVTEEPAYNIYIEEIPELEQKESSIMQVKNGEVVNFEYEFAIKEAEEGASTAGTLEIKANNIENTRINLLSNKIKDAKLKCSLRNTMSDDYQITSSDYLPLENQIKNISDKKLENVIVEIKLPSIAITSTDEILEMIDEETKYELVEYDTKSGILKFKIKEIDVDEIIYIHYTLYPTEMDIKSLSEDMTTSYTAYLEKEENIKYYSNYITRNVMQDQTIITVKQTSNKEQGTVLEQNDQITFETEIKNEGAIDKNVDIIDELPQGLYAIDAYYEYDNKKIKIEIDDDSSINLNMDLKVGTLIKLVITVEVNVEDCTEKEIANVVKVVGDKVSEYSNELTYKLDIPEKEEDIEFEGDNDQDTTERLPENDDEIDSDEILDGDKNDQNQSQNRPNQEKSLNISGMAWVDKDANGNRDSSDKGISGIKVHLINSQTGESIKNTITTSDGAYKFEKLNVGSYLVAFEYDTTKYRVTSYKKDLVDESTNSDVIKSQIELNGEQKIVAITDKIELQEENIDNIDAGLVENEKFDLNLNKYISKITVQNNAGTTVKQYDNTQMAKVEIKAKNLAGSLVLIEYSINITNEGELDGYVGEILDYMPKDLKFNSEINKDWYTSTDGMLHNITLANDTISVGETKTVKLVLTKTMTNDNTGLIINTAEIGKASNKLNIADIDSTPGNKADGEDDMSNAEVLISVSTGREIFMAILIILIMVAFAGATVWIIKRKEGENE